jgi:hypothetical protein
MTEDRTTRADGGTAAETPLVSVVIVCMDNLGNLRRCLPSLKAHTSVPFETLVTAYLFTPENLAAARAEFPWARFIESGEIRGFSENNNLALWQARGKYCFVLNDDTELRMATIDKLIETMERLPGNAAIVSPKILWPDGRVQVCGVPPKDWRHFLAANLHVWHESRGRGVNGSGVFRTYNICGAAFLIRTEVFRKLGWFDERFFFCPEDLALSTAAGRAGYGVWVDADAEVVHAGGMSGQSLSWTQAAVRPAAYRGALMFYGDRWWKALALRAGFAAIFACKAVFHGLKALWRGGMTADRVLAAGDLRVVRTCFSRKLPKEIFMRYWGRTEGA